MRQAAVVSLAASVFGITGFALSVWAQNSGGSGLVVQINPEAHLNPSTAQLAFSVTNPGQTIVSAPVTITAWVRATPNRQIRLAAQPLTVTGPAATVSPGTISWRGAMTGATGGAAAAVCTSGSFSAAGPQQLISGWNQSGIAKCMVTFTFTTDVAWPKGTYSGQVDFSLFTE